MRLQRHLLTIVLCAALFGGASALAQSAVVTGTIDGQVDGTATTWTTLQFVADGERQDTVEIHDDGFAVDVVIQAHVEPRYVLAGALVLTGSFASLATCPCAATELEVFYLAEGSMFANAFKAAEGSLVIDAATPLGDGRWRLQGRFGVEAPFYADLFGAPDPERRASISGAFDVEGGPLDF